MSSKPGIPFIIAAFVLIDSLFITCLNNSKKGSAPTKPDSPYSEQSVIRAFPVDSAKYRQGQSIFIADCNVCHGGKNKTDNYLEGVVQRVGISYLTLYLTKQDSLITAKEKYALELKKAFGNLASSHNFKYSDEQLSAIIEYLK